jgi:hypothetical protein
MSDIINTKNTRSDVDIESIEREMISEGLMTKGSNDDDLVHKYESELIAVAEKLGIPHNDLINAHIQQPTVHHQPPSPIVHHQPPPPTHHQPPPPTHQPPPEQYKFPDNPFATQSHTTTHTSEHTPEPDSIVSYTREEERRNHIRSVIGDARSPDSVDELFEQEKREDNKCKMLAEIDGLIELLTLDNADLSRIEKVDANTPYQRVDMVLRILRRKADEIRYRSFANEFLLFGAHALEEAFDGKTEYFGKYKPNLTGWHKQVNAKLKRMERDTGEVVSTMMRDYKIGSALRIGLELVPNAILYSRRMAEQTQTPTYTDTQMSYAYERLNRTT